MEEYFLIGIGGTGARVLEAFVHCCAAGFGPKGQAVHVMLIDPDGANGNLNRTQKLVEQYRALRSKIKPELEPGNPAFQTELLVPEKGFVWGIFENSSDQSGPKTLANYIGYEGLERQQPALAAAANLLFTKQELGTPLNEGFRGHPSIGAVVMANPPLFDPQSPLRMLTATGAANKTARMFLVGSIFGGTGAAGFPTMGKVLKQRLGEAWGSVLLGGALVLPYFSFVPDPKAEGEMFVTPADFPGATKAALHYYDENELDFNQYYLVGDSLSQTVGKFSPGAGTQENDPHYVELVSALAAFDFFGQGPTKPDDEKQYFVAGRKTADVGWDDLPVSRAGASPDRRVEFRQAISTFTLFCYTYRTLGGHYLADIRKNGKLPDSWFRDTFNDFSAGTARTNPGHLDHSDLLDKKMMDYAAAFLTWITSMAGNDHNDNGRNVKLIDRQMLLDRNAAKVDSNGQPQLPLINPPRENLGRLVHGFLAKRNNADFVFSSLNGSARRDDTTRDAPYRLLNLFFRAAPDFLGFERSPAAAQ